MSSSPLTFLLFAAWVQSAHAVCSACDKYIVKSGSDIIGTLLSAKAAQSKEECCSTCTNNATCDSWSYVKATCYLKSGFQGIYTNDGVVAGYLAPPRSTCSNYEVRVDNDVSGNMVSQAFAESKEVCCGKCDATSSTCEAWSFSAHDSRCYLKSGFQGTYASNGMVAGYRKPPHTTCSNYEVKRDSDVSGNMISQEVGESTEQCCGKCDALAMCEAWSFSAQWSKCYLKSAFQGTYSNKGIIAGIKKHSQMPSVLGANGTAENLMV